jgi:hypothetical protein
MAAQTEPYEDEEAPQREEAPPSWLRAVAEKYLLAKEAAIALGFSDAAGSMCGALLPTGRSTDVVDGVAVTCIDNGMPVVVMRADAVGREVTIQVRIEQRDVEADVRNASGLHRGPQVLRRARLQKEESASLSSRGSAADSLDSAIRA